MSVAFDFFYPALFVVVVVVGFFPCCTASLAKERFFFFFALVHRALKGGKRKTTLSEIAGKYHFYKLSISHPLD